MILAQTSFYPVTQLHVRICKSIFLIIVHVRIGIVSQCNLFFPTEPLWMIETSPLRYILMTKRFMQIASQVNNTCSLFTAYMHGFIVYLGYIQQFLFLKDLLFTSKIHIHIHFNTNSLVVSNSLRYDELLFQLRIEKCERWNNYVMILTMDIMTQIHVCCCTCVSLIN